MDHPECKRCPLWETAISVGIGARGAGSVMLVGEAPGAAEDVAGEAFVGEAGRVLDSMLSKAGLEGVVYTNAVRCRPPKNRKPTPKEIEACKPWLVEDIKAYEPEAVVALGDTALRSLCKRTGIRSLRGQVLAIHKSLETSGAPPPVFASYHPAYVLRVPAFEPTVVSDLRRVRNRGQAETVVTWTSDAVPLSGTVAWDIETDWVKGDPSSGRNIIQWAASDGTHTRVSTDLGELGRVVREADTPVTHNGWAFDVPRARDSGLAVRWGDDTMPLAYLDDESQPLGLEALCVKYLGVTGWKEGLNAKLGTDDFRLYNARDAAYTRALYATLCDRLGPRKRVADVIIAPAFRALQSCTERGIYIDRGAIDRARDYFAQRMDYGLRGMAVLGGVSSPTNAEIGAALIREGHRLPLTESGLPCTDQAVLASLPQTQLVKAVRYYRKAAKSMQAGVNRYDLLSREGDGRVHPPYPLWRTVTGRTSSYIHTLAREPMLRAFFGAPDGYDFVVADYAAIEFRLAAFIAGERGILARYDDNPFWDAHRFVASLLYGKPESEVTTHERQIAKSANFGLLYMAQWETLRDYTLKTTGILLTEAEARGIRSFWHKTFPGFLAWYQRTADQLFTEGYVESLTGRRRHFGDPSLLQRSLASEALREGVNFQVQSFGADVALLGLSSCVHQYDVPRLHGRGSAHASAAYEVSTTSERVTLPANGFFHDAVSFEFARGALGEETRERIRTAMVESPRQVLRRSFGIDLTVPLTIEIKSPEGKWNL